jgi:hypothetical protein
MFAREKARALPWTRQGPKGPLYPTQVLGRHAGGVLRTTAPAGSGAEPQPFSVKHPASEPKRRPLGDVAQARDVLGYLFVAAGLGGVEDAV